MSNYEMRVLELLKEGNIDFVREKSFQDLHGGKYRYDFFLNKLGIIIEVNGEQHYYPVNHFHKNRAQFLSGQEHDRRKFSYALANHYIMYAIPYWEIESLKKCEDLFQDKFRVKSKWHNDLAWHEYNSLE